MAKLNASKDRLQDLLNSAINYLVELKQSNQFESEIEVEEFFRYTIGLNDEELKFYGISTED